MVEVKHLYTGSKHTIVSFSSIGNTIQGVNREFYNLKNNGYNVIWVLDHNKSYFSAIDINEITKHIKTYNVYAIGNSMGGFNAIMFSNFYPTQKVLAFSPQFSMDKTIVPWEDRWRKQITWKKFKYPKATFVNWTDYCLITGHKAKDQKHMSMMPDTPNINKQTVFGGHVIAEKFKKSGNLYRLINDYFKEDVEITEPYLQSLL